MYRYIYIYHYIYIYIHNNKTRKQDKTRTKQEPSPRDKEIENLKNEIRILKQSQTNSMTGNNPKNAQMASTPGGQTTKTQK